MTRALAVAALAGFLLAAHGAEPRSYGGRPEVRAFIEEMVARHQFVARELEYVFARARHEPAILKAIRPQPTGERRPWEAYRALFVNDRSIEAGTAFWREHRVALERARRDFGVPAEIVVAILGVETAYGRNAGRWRVIDALTTLAFDYPPRAEFFRGELASFLILARDSGNDVFSVRGSYAGAIGIPQFMPGSYLRYAVDFDSDGAIDLRASPADAIGSVANFLKQHGWEPDAPVMATTVPRGDAHRAYIDGGVEPRHTVAELASAGAIADGLPPQARAVLIELDNGQAAPEHRIGLRNFYVLTRYNRSTQYAAAVWDLAEALRAAVQPAGR